MIPKMEKILRYPNKVKILNSLKLIAAHLKITMVFQSTLLLKPMLKLWRLDSMMATGVVPTSIHRMSPSQMSHRSSLSSP